MYHWNPNLIWSFQGKRLEACEIMENLGENTYKPAIIGALTTIYLGLGEESAALKLFEKSVSWYKKNKVCSISV